MSPTLLLSLISLAIKETPELIATLKTLFAMGDVSPETIEALRAQINGESFATLAPNSEAQIEAAEAAAPAPAVTDQAVTAPGPVTPAESPAPAPKVTLPATPAVSDAGGSTTPPPVTDQAAPAAAASPAPVNTLGHVSPMVPD